MMDFIVAPLVVGICTLGIYKLFELFVLKRERILMIEKFGDRLDLGDIKERISLPLLPVKINFKTSFGALKSGCLMVGVGLGLFLAFVICSTAFPAYTTGDKFEQIQQQTSIVYASCVILFGGIGLIVAFLIEMNIQNKEKE